MMANRQQLDPLLTAVLDSSRERKQQSVQAYIAFLRLAIDSVSTCRASRVAVTASYNTRDQRMSSSKLQNTNVSLVLLYNFYVQRSRNDRSAVKTYITTKDSALGFQGVELLCYDFDIIPKLISRDDLKLLWRTLSLERLANQEPALHYLSFEEFLAFFLKLAFKIFSNMNLVKVIRAVAASTAPTAEEKVQYLCNYLNLADELHIREHLRKLGATVAKDFVKRPSDLPAALPTKTVRNKNIYSSMSTLSMIAGKTRALPPKPFSRRLPAISPSKPRKGEVEIEHILPWNLRETLQRGDESINELLREDLDEEQGQDDDDDSSEEDEPSSRLGLSDDSTSAMSLPRPVPVEEDDRPDLVDYLTRYSSPTLVATQSKYFDSEGPFVDLGFIFPGVEYKINFTITNNTHDVLNIDVTTRELNGCRVSAVTRPSPLVQGLKRRVHLSLIVQGPESPRSVVGFVDIHLLGTRRDQPGVSIVSCPIHFDVIQSGEEHWDLPKCSLKNLPALLLRYGACM